MKSNLDLYKKASDLEETNPEEALEIYNKLEKENKEFHKDILLTAIICPIFASIIAFLVVQFIESHQTIVTILVLSVIGFGPPLLLSGAKFVEKQERHTGVKVKSIELALVLLMGPIIIIGDLITLTVLVLGTVIIKAIFLIIPSIIYHFLTGAPFIWQTEFILPENIKILLFSVFFIPIFLFVMSEVRLKPFSTSPHV